ncbi:MAG: Nif3-like dinuclear metal center hexameric protein [Puniceicoccales bacterium]|nr:Nif3-like dinuclear metal center hexameric protein [Puniceicoccales bacterium]
MANDMSPTNDALHVIVNFCDQLLRVAQFSDYPNAHNGLQVANSGKITHLGAAVDANRMSIEGAIAMGVDMLLVHHGLFWGRSLPITGHRRENYKLLLDNDIAVYSAHLPLDCHPEFGNNALIMRKLGISPIHHIPCDHDFTMPVGKFNGPREALKNALGSLFPRTIGLEFGGANINRVLVCSGGGGGTIAAMEDVSFDSVITGEAPRHFFDFAYERRLNAYVCGHYATEVFGVRALAQKVSDKFNIPWSWIEENCPL